MGFRSHDGPVHRRGPGLVSDLHLPLVQESRKEKSQQEGRKEERKFQKEEEKVIRPLSAGSYQVKARLARKVGPLGHSASQGPPTFTPPVSQRILSPSSREGKSPGPGAGRLDLVQRLVGDRDKELPRRGRGSETPRGPSRPSVTFRGRDPTGQPGTARRVLDLGRLHSSTGSIGSLVGTRGVPRSSE